MPTLTLMIVVMGTGVLDSVAPVTDSELESYKKIDFSVSEFTADCGVERTIHDNKADLLMHRWRNPTLSIHGVEGAFYGEGAKTVIPRK
eukprot:Pgem_evm1s7499